MRTLKKSMKKIIKKLKTELKGKRLLLICMTSYKSATIKFKLFLSEIAIKISI